MNENPYEKRDDELGALWEKEGAKGVYWTGSVTIDGVKTDIVVFANQYRSKENHPSYRILRSRPQGEKHTYAPSTRRDERERPYDKDLDQGPPRKPQAASRPGPATWANAPRVASPRPASRPKQADWTDDVPPVEDDGDVPF